MITWLAPLALALFAVLPILWWIHRREPKPAAVTVPSLLFLEDENQDTERPERRRIDRDLLLALAAAAALTIAAAGPVLGRTSDGRRILVLRDDSPAMAAKSAGGTTAADRALAASEAIRGLTGGSDRFEAVAASGGELTRRLRDATGGLRVLVSDRRPRELPAGVAFVGVGDPAGVNAGIVSIDVDVVAGRRRVSATIWNDAAMSRSLRAGPMGSETDVACPAFGAVRASWDLGPIRVADEAKPTIVHLIDDGGSLGADDAVVIDPSPIRVAFARDGLSTAVTVATKRALDAILVGAWKEDATAQDGLFVGPIEDAPYGVALVLEIGRVPTGVEPVRPDAHDAVSPVDSELARDLDLASSEWQYPPGPTARAPWPRITINRDSRDPKTVHLWVVPTRGHVRWHADPSLGRPPAIDTPLWPLFIENVVRLIGGAPGSAGHRWKGVLDPNVTRLGRDVVPFDESALAAAPRDVIARRNALGPWLAGVGSICLAVLWFRPRKGAASPVR